MEAQLQNQKAEHAMDQEARTKLIADSQLNVAREHYEAEIDDLRVRCQTAEQRAQISSEDQESKNLQEKMMAMTDDYQLVVSQMRQQSMAEQMLRDRTQHEEAEEAMVNTIPCNAEDDLPARDSELQAAELQ